MATKPELKTINASVWSEWDYCDCNARIPNLKVVPCGCGDHDIELSGRDIESVVHLCGAHFIAACALDLTTSILDKYDRRMNRARELLTLLDDYEVSCEDERWKDDPDY